MTPAPEFIDVAINELLKMLNSEIRSRPTPKVSLSWNRFSAQSPERLRDPGRRPHLISGAGSFETSTARCVGRSCLVFGRACCQGSSTRSRIPVYTWIMLQPAFVVSAASVDVTQD